jgi:hypothetical protein
MENEQPLSLFGLSIDEESNAVLRVAAQWGKLLSVLGFVLAALVFVLGIIIYNKITGSYSGNDYASHSIKTLATRYLIACILFAGVFVTGAVFTLNFSNRITTALNTSDQPSLNSGLAAIKSGIIFRVVIFIIFIILILLAFIGLAAV